MSDSSTEDSPSRVASETYTKSARNPDALVLHHAVLVKRIAHHLKARLPSSVQVDDLYQSGMIGLLEAARNYNPVQGASFETYAGIRIRGAMIDELRKNDWTPKSVHRKSREVYSAIRTIEARVGRDARDQEIVDELGISMEEYHNILSDGMSSALFSLEALGIEDILQTTSTSAGADTYQEVALDKLRQGVSHAIKTLPERERLVVTLYYESELNLREIGEVIGVSESRVSQLMSQSLARLKARLQEWIEE